MKEILDALHSAHAASPLDEIADQLGRVDLTAELDDAVRGVHGNAALCLVVGSEELRLHLVREGHVVGSPRRRGSIPYIRPPTARPASSERDTK